MQLRDGTVRTERESEVLGYERTDDSKVFFVDMPKTPVPDI